MYFQRLAITIGGLQAEPPPSGASGALSVFEELASVVAASLTQIPAGIDQEAPPAPTAILNTDDFAFALVPTGVILSFGGSTAPSGFVLCDGSAISRTEYAELFAVIGTTYGVGDGSTTFNVPDTSSSVVGDFTLGTSVGANTVDISHSHGVGTLATNTTGDHDHGGATGAAGTQAAFAGIGANAAPELHTHSISGDGDHSHTISGSTATGGDSTHDNRPKTLGVNFIIKV